MVVKLNCKKSDVVGGITKAEVVGGITKVEVVGGITGITRYRSPEKRQAMFFQKLLAKLHEFFQKLLAKFHEVTLSK